MSDELHEQIYNSLNLKETDELMEIWQANDHTAWSDMAFEVMEKILHERLETVPPQDPVYLDSNEEDIDEDNDDEMEEDGESDKFLDPENAPVFYDPQKVLQVSDWLVWAAQGSVAISIVLALLQFPNTQHMIMAYLRLPMDFVLFAFLITVISFCLGIGLQILVVYVPLKAFAEVLKILMEMEFNSRKVK